MAKIGLSPALAATATAILLDREELPGGPFMKQFYRRMGFVMNGAGRPARLSVFPRGISKLKTAFVQLAAARCVPDVVPGGHICGDCPAKMFCRAYRESNRTGPKPRDRTFIDVFAGGGGLSWGLSQAGLRLSVAVEIDTHAADTLYLNHPEAVDGRVDSRDIAKVLEDEAFVKAHRGIDVLAGGPPCQPFSMARRHSQADVRDSRRDLFKAYLDAIRKLEPKAVVMENVPGLLTANDGRTIRSIMAGLEGEGYEAEYRTYNASDFGVPQSRKRVIIVGLNRQAFGDAESTLGQFFEDLDALRWEDDQKPPTWHALSGLPRLAPGEGGEVLSHRPPGRRTKYAKQMQAGGRLVYNHIARDHNDRDLEIYRDMRQGETAREFAKREDGRIPYQVDSFGDKYRKLHARRPAPTIPAHLRRDANSFIHPTQNRGITGREAARLQSFPDDYIFLGGFGPTFVQVGNAVPPLMAEAVGQCLVKALADVS